MLTLLVATIVGAALPPADPRTSGRVLDGTGTVVQVTAPGEYRATYQPSEWPNLSLVPAGAAAWDWSRAGALAFEVFNPGSRPAEFGVRVDDDVRADGVVHCRSGTGAVGPGETATFAMTFAPDPESVGMRGLPARPGERPTGAGGSGPFALGHIVRYQFFMHLPPVPTTLVIRRVRLEPPISLDGIVDRFGQYTRADWPGKVHAERELAERRQQEDGEEGAHPRLAGRDEYGGWADGPTLPATGFFRTDKYHGKWALVTPSGHLFFSLGIDTIQPSETTFTTGRDRMFTLIPKPGDPLAHFAGHVSGMHSGPVTSGADMDFYGANLYRKYGEDWSSQWLRSALRRLPAWGFNTVGNWSDERFYGPSAEPSPRRHEDTEVTRRRGRGDERPSTHSPHPPTPSPKNGRGGANAHRSQRPDDLTTQRHVSRVPYVATAGIGGDHARVASGSDYWSKMHDPFDPQFARDVEASLRDVTARVKGDPWCVGYFVDNELSWAGGGEDGGRYGLGYGALAADAEQSPAKRALVEQLRAKYGDIAAFNAAWEQSVGSWQSLRSPFRPTGASNAARKADLSAFVKEFARRYFRTIRDVLKRDDANHLYLGCRFAWHNPEAVEAAAEMCDVVSFNIYAARVGHEWDYLARLGKPCIIGEFHFGALDRGMFHPGLVATPNQQARAATYRAYLESVLDNPALVGCHWFQYTDEPLTGRTWDGENYSIGFVDVTDTPYPEMVAAAKQVHATAYIRRFGGGTAKR